MERNERRKFADISRSRKKKKGGAVNNASSDFRSALALPAQGLDLIVPHNAPTQLVGDEQAYGNADARNERSNTITSKLILIHCAKLYIYNWLVIHVTQSDFLVFP